MYPSKQDPIINYVLLPMYNNKNDISQKKNNKNDREKPIIIQIKNRQRITLYKVVLRVARGQPNNQLADP